MDSYEHLPFYKYTPLDQAYSIRVLYLHQVALTKKNPNLPIYGSLEKRYLLIVAPTTLHSPILGTARSSIDRYCSTIQAEARADS